jgi:hypothetical protein
MVSVADKEQAETWIDHKLIPLHVSFSHYKVSGAAWLDK